MRLFISPLSPESAHPGRRISPAFTHRREKHPFQVPGQQPSRKSQQDTRRQHGGIVTRHPYEPVEDGKKPVMEKNDRKVASAAKQAALTALGERLRAARINAGLTQQKVAERLEVTPQSVRNWEAGRSEPAVKAVDTLAALYGVAPRQLTGQALDPRPENRDQPPDQRVDVEPRLLQEARKISRLSQAEASEQAGVSIVTLRRYEQGTVRPTRSMMMRLALIYEKPGAWFEPDGADSALALEAPHMDRAMRAYLLAQPDLSPRSVETIADFILFTHNRQMKKEREDNACAPSEQMAS